MVAAAACAPMYILMHYRKLSKLLYYLEYEKICTILQISLLITSREYVIYPEWHWTNLNHGVQTKESKNLAEHIAFRLWNGFCETTFALSTRVEAKKSARGLWLDTVFFLKVYPLGIGDKQISGKVSNSLQVSKFLPFRCLVIFQ